MIICPSCQGHGYMKGIACSLCEGDGLVTQQQAYKSPIPARRVNKKIKRLCLKCQKMFNSVWIGNRICPTCATRNEKTCSGINSGGTTRRRIKKL